MGCSRLPGSPHPAYSRAEGQVDSLLGMVCQCGQRQEKATGQQLAVAHRAPAALTRMPNFQEAKTLLGPPPSEGLRNRPLALRLLRFDDDDSLVYSRTLRDPPFPASPRRATTRRRALGSRPALGDRARLRIPLIPRPRPPTSPRSCTCHSRTPARPLPLIHESNTPGPHLDR